LTWTTKVSGRIDWKAERERTDLAAVATKLLGPAPGRRGERGRRLYWHCPFHEDQNPSFCVEPGKGWWRCFGCGENGDAASLVMKLNGATFPEAVAFLTGGPAPSGKALSRPAPTPPRRPPPEPSGLPESEGWALVETAAARLLSAEGAHALTYLTGPRCLSLATIRAARLGWTSGVDLPKAAGGTFRAVGWVIPWFVGDRLALVKIRQPDDRRPKYVEAYRKPARLICYPAAAAIRPGRPLVITEGELDALVLGEVLGDLASAVTLGSASARPESVALGVMLSAPRWYVATDADSAGDKSAAEWPARARRIRPPEPFKDWSEARAGGVDLARWWRDIVAGIDRPALFTWPELAACRWGPALGDAEGGIVFDRPDVGRRRAAIKPGTCADDPGALAERTAIQQESDG
jgi:hypothetical protein